MKITRCICLFLALLTVLCTATLWGCAGEPPVTEQQGEAYLEITGGTDGKSAYQLAVEAGFTGDRSAWLAEIGAAWSDTEKAAELQELLTLKHELRVHEDGSFKVLVFSDVQCSSMQKLIDTGTVDNIEKIVKREKPDLVLFAGDISYGISSAKKLRDYLSVMVEYIEDMHIPWAHVYGNHDTEVSEWYSAISKEEQQAIYESFEYCVSKAGDESLFGIGNYVLPVMSHDGSSIAFNVWALDTGSYTDTPSADIVNKGNYFYGKYEGMQEDQVEWYKQTSVLLEEFNGGKVPGMVYFHIPLQETYTAWDWDRKGIEGQKLENISAPTVNAGLFEAIRERGDVSLVIHGHDHINDFATTYKGVQLCYTASIGTEVYHDTSMLGGRVVTFSTADPTKFETSMSRVNN